MVKKILVIEDDNAILEVIHYILESHSYKVMASNKIETVQSIIKMQPNLVLLDDRLTTGSGHVLCLSIKQDPVGKSIPVILVSAVTNLKQVAVDCCADAYIEKPFDLDGLLQMVEEFAI